MAGGDAMVRQFRTHVGIVFGIFLTGWSLLFLNGHTAGDVRAPRRQDDYSALVAAHENISRHIERLYRLLVAYNESKRETFMQDFNLSKLTELALAGCDLSRRAVVAQETPYEKDVARR